MARRRAEAGASMIAVIFLIVVVGFFGMIMVSLSATQQMTSLNELQSTQALFVAEGGLDRAVNLLLTPTLGGRVPCASAALPLPPPPPPPIVPFNPGEFMLNREANSPFYPAAATTIQPNPGPGVSAIDTTIPVATTVGYAPFGRIMIDRELIDYTGTTINSFTGALRGRDGTLATPHVAGARVGQSQCTVTSTGGVTDLTAGARGRRVQRAGIQLQEAWAVGDGGTILRWNGTAWVQFATTGTRLQAVSADSYANGWAIGDPLFGFLPQIRRWNPDGTPAWDFVVGPIQARVRLNAVQSMFGNQAWAVGNSGGGGGGTCTNNRARILQWNGVVWNCVPSPSNQHLNGVFMLDSDSNGIVDSGWAVGNSGGGGGGACTNNRARILQWNGAAWNCVVSPSSEDLNAVFMVSNVEGWAVGRRRGCGNPGPTILRWVPPNWVCQGGAVIPTPAQADRDLNSVFINSAIDGWAVGNSGGGGGGGTPCTNNRARILQWNGTTWTCAPSPINQDLHSVACATTNDCWAVGDAGSIVHWDGAAWTVHPQSGVVTGQNLRGIHVVAPRTRPQAMWREVVS